MVRRGQMLHRVALILMYLCCEVSCSYHAGKEIFCTSDGEIYKNRVASLTEVNLWLMLIDNVSFFFKVFLCFYERE